MMQTEAARGPGSRYRVALTDTRRENNIGELGALLHFFNSSWRGSVLRRFLGATIIKATRSKVVQLRA